ncbi:hypothetical protein [Streptomyces candidus]|uniref:Uncharacterized protein n=1 Tax=Streptomyces candidus TaxID=67283 RepID=A0A7X0HKK1_9ACTN|nr:hypothetical protein [Streptomyces candidus]MBB6439374.1 hypothetical protein [Streptomyces candidus]GHH54994.1 hypothetical protein GCM10018773_58830 [Streptomyces candidus]
MSRTTHHRRPRPARKGNPTRVLGVDDRAAARAGILTTAVRLDDGYPQYSRSANVWAKPGVRKAYQTAAHRRDRAAVRAALSTTGYRNDPARLQSLRMERALTPVTRRRVNWDMS